MSDKQGERRGQWRAMIAEQENSGQSGPRTRGSSPDGHGIVKLSHNLNLQVAAGGVDTGNVQDSPALLAKQCFLICSNSKGFSGFKEAALHRCRYGMRTIIGAKLGKNVLHMHFHRGFRHSKL
jgi:hypothetical protein